MTAIYLAGMGITVTAFALLFARRYPGQRNRLVVGIIIGLLAMIVWPITVWLAMAMWLTGFARPSSQPQQSPLLRKRIALPLATLGGLGTLVVFGASADPVPPSEAETAPPVAATSPSPTATPFTSQPAVTSTTSVTSATSTSSSTPTSTPAPRPQPAPRPEPKPRPQPRPQDESNESSDQRSPESEEESASPRTRPRTGNSGHPCGPGERDGDSDGYCGER